ncbi:MAG: sodium:proton antiporter [Acidocella sp. 20-57-95]|nr:MAG: sodium:proton antiporter [Acidocella sp. 20-57-95]OYV61045.1 MAG: sodium:proton antiporter [Acidocella sp. 21-58-7]HQT65098.1 sodium:proton antiporter [Acidocella sp.]HQU04109.1 sodium:proton antiporter [Acidocella sp.]
MSGLLSLPFAMVLLSFAVLPGLAPRIWHRHMAVISLAWVGLALLLTALVDGAGAAAADIWNVSIVEFLPFIVLLLALYALGGGILITGGPWGRPAGNLLLLVIGTLLAAIMGTIGASLLLIHPLLAANAHRFEKRHLVLAFIILVGNAGGALSPLGDPPLLVGFLRGVPFFWPLIYLWAPLVVLAVPVLALCFGLDMYFARREARPKAQPLRVRGGLNIFLLLVLMVAIPIEGVWHPGTVRILTAKLPGEHVVVTLLAVICIAVSEFFTAKSIRAHNRFAWSAMREIVILFFAIFATITPVFALLARANLNADQPLLWFWASGIASAVLDAAPTYLIFFQAAGGNAAQLAAAPSHLLTALAAGSVFFGPVTYLGNAPNLMIREIAARRAVKMPGFFAYAAVMMVVLVPIYVVMSWIFF